jgi:hypothetical protein
MNDIERAELIQSLKSFLIPSSLFVACLINSAGIYIIYTGNNAGIPFLVVGFSIIIWAMVAFVQFQNKQRAQGKFKRAAANAEAGDSVKAQAEVEVPAAQPAEATEHKVGAAGSLNQPADAIR